MTSNVALFCFCCRFDMKVNKKPRAVSKKMLLFFSIKFQKKMSPLESLNVLFCPNNIPKPNLLLYNHQSNFGFFVFKKWWINWFKTRLFTVIPVFTQVIFLLQDYSAWTRLEHLDTRGYAKRNTFLWTFYAFFSPSSCHISACTVCIAWDIPPATYHWSRLRF